MQKTGNKTTLLTRGGKERLGPLTLKQLTEKLDTASGKKKDRYLKEIARKTKMGLVYNAPAPEEETHEETQSA